MPRVRFSGMPMPRGHCGQEMSPPSTGPSYTGGRFSFGTVRSARVSGLRICFFLTGFGVTEGAGRVSGTEGSTDGSTDGDSVTAGVSGGTTSFAASTSSISLPPQPASRAALSTRPVRPRSLVPPVIPMRVTPLWAPCCHAW